MVVIRHDDGKRHGWTARRLGNQARAWPFLASFVFATSVLGIVTRDLAARALRTAIKSLICARRYKINFMNLIARNAQLNARLASAPNDVGLFFSILFIMLAARSSTSHHAASEESPPRKRIGSRNNSILTASSIPRL